MGEHADRIRALLRSGSWEQQSQGRELLAAAGDGALYAEVLAGWAWEEGDWTEGRRSLRWIGGDSEPFSEDIALALWLDAPPEAPWAPGLERGARRW